MCAWIGSKCHSKEGLLTPSEDPLEDYGQFERPLPKLLNFTTDIVNGIQVIGVHIYRIESHTTKKHQWTLRVWIKLNEEVMKE